MDLKWSDTEELAIRLVEAHPTADPLTVRFTDMHT
nr:Fe-S cluster assembly protein IscX [Nitrospira sp.]